MTGHYRVWHLPDVDECKTCRVAWPCYVARQITCTCGCSNMFHNSPDGHCVKVRCENQPCTPISPEPVVRYGDVGSLIDRHRFPCTDCWEDRYIWYGNAWGMQHKGDACDCPCHDGEVWLG